VFDPVKAYNSETNVYRIELISKRARLAQVIAHSEAMKRLDDAPESRETKGVCDGDSHPRSLEDLQPTRRALHHPRSQSTSPLPTAGLTWTEARSRSWSTKRLILNVKSDMDDELHITLG
jgi:hypothetical protein